MAQGRGWLPTHSAGSSVWLLSVHSSEHFDFPGTSSSHYPILCYFCIRQLALSQQILFLVPSDVVHPLQAHSPCMPRDHIKRAYFEHLANA